ncbi:hypothetical protein [Streptomyces humicola]|nr:hypothetical protein [Streptomyces humicola]
MAVWVGRLGLLLLSTPQGLAHAACGFLRQRRRDVRVPRRDA